MDDQIRLALFIVVRMQITRLPWRLLTGAEKRPARDVEEGRREEAAKRIVAAIEERFDVAYRPPAAKRPLSDR